MQKGVGKLDDFWDLYCYVVTGLGVIGKIVFWPNSRAIVY